MFQITKDSKLPYKYYPKDKFELRKILELRLAEDKDADLNDIDVSAINDMGYEGFDNMTGLFEFLDPHNIKINAWNMSNVTNVEGMFWYCPNFDADLSDWDMSGIKYMSQMFRYCTKFNHDLSNWDVSHVDRIHMHFIFDGCKSLTIIPKWYVLNKLCFK